MNRTSPSEILRKTDSRSAELYSMLCQKNGFFCFEGSLRVFPSNKGDSLSLEEWNSPNLWRQEYGAMADKCLFFAEDVFGNQFAIAQNRIVSFKAETGTVEAFADSIAEWSSKILEDFDYLTGHSLAHAWQSLHTTLATTDRLLPKRPFTLGGEYAVENLYSANGVKAMQWQGYLATQLRDLPDGTAIELRVVD